jgi:hypothetical protein
MRFVKIDILYKEIEGGRPTFAPHLISAPITVIYNFWTEEIKLPQKPK